MNFDELQQQLDDYAIVTYLKGNCFERHTSAIRQEAMDRILNRGQKLVDGEVKVREYARLKQMVLDFETLHPEIKS